MRETTERAEEDAAVTYGWTELHEAYCLDALRTRRFTHAELWEVLGRIVDASSVLERRGIGISAEGRPLYAVRFGEGPERVLAFSQMHGDEPTHTLALADLLCWVAREADDPRVARLRERVTLWAVPMLNPDGAQRFRRPNAQGIDINRDAFAWTSPELRALRGLYQRVAPGWAFNLHDQDVRTRVSQTEKLAAYALLACPSSEAGDDNDARVRAKRVAGAIRRAVEPLVRDRLTRYPDAFDGSTIGEWMQRSGAATVLLEAGFWPRDPERQYLRGVGFASLVAALEAIGDGTWREVALDAYEALPENGEDAVDLVVRGATIVVPGLEPYRADLGVKFQVPLDLEDGRVEEVGDLQEHAAREVLQADGLFLHPDPEALERVGGNPPTLAAGCPATFVLRRGPEASSPAVYRVERGIITPAAGTEPSGEEAEARARAGEGAAAGERSAA